MGGERYESVVLGGLYFGPVDHCTAVDQWTSVDQCGPMWPSVDLCGSVWTIIVDHPPWRALRCYMYTVCHVILIKN